MLRSDFRHLLVDGDRVPIRRSKLAAGQPDRDTIVMMAERAGVMQSADRRDHAAVLFERLERS